MNVLSIIKKDRNLFTGVKVTIVSYAHCKEHGMFQDYCTLSSKISMLLVLCDALIDCGKITYSEKHYLIDVMNTMQTMCYKCCKIF